jgi:hypothetical protein
MMPRDDGIIQDHVGGIVTGHKPPLEATRNAEQHHSAMRQMG